MKKLTKAQKKKRKEAKAERQRKYKWVMINGRQVRIKKPPTIAHSIFDLNTGCSPCEQTGWKVKTGNRVFMISRKDSSLISIYTNQPAKFTYI